MTIIIGIVIIFGLEEERQSDYQSATNWTGLKNVVI